MEHHYKPPEKTKPEDLTALCSTCHRIASAIKARHKKMVFKEQELDQREEELNEQEEEIRLREQRIEGIEHYEHFIR